MTVQFLSHFTGELAVFLIAVNGAIIWSFWPEPWLSLKLSAVSLLLGYVAATMFAGPRPWMFCVAFAATVYDSIAVFGIWHGLHRARGSEEGVLIAYRRR